MFRIETRVEPDGTKTVNVEVEVATEAEAAGLEMALEYGAIISTCVVGGCVLTEHPPAPPLDPAVEESLLGDPAVRSAMDSATEGYGAERTIILPIDRERRESLPVQHGIMVPIQSEDLADLIRDARCNIAEEGATVAFRHVVDRAEAVLMQIAGLTSSPA